MENEKEIIRKLFKDWLFKLGRGGNYKDLVSEYLEHIKFLLSDEADEEDEDYSNFSLERNFGD